MIIKVCKKHGDLTKDQCYLYTTKKGLKYYRCYICMKEVTKKLKENGYFTRYNRSEKRRGKQKEYYEKVKHTKEFKEKRKKYYPDTRKWNQEHKKDINYILKAREREKKYRILNPERYRIAKCKTKERARKFLRDTYIKTLIRHRKMNEFSNNPEFIDLIRQMLRIKRLIIERKSA